MTHVSFDLLTISMEFEYLNNVPVLTLDVNEDFKGDQIKCANMLEKVRRVAPYSKYVWINI